MELESYLEVNGIPFERDVSLYRATKRNNGGLCAFYCKPKTNKAIKELVGFLNWSSTDYHLIGDSSNCYFLEKDEPAVIVTTRGFAEVIYEDDDVIECSSGFNLNKLAKICIEKNIFGYEGFLGIPGTVGGAVVNNTGAFESEMSKVVRAITVVDSEGVETKIKAEDLGFELRSSLLKRGELAATILSVEFDVSNKVNKRELSEKVEYVVSFRKKYIDNNKVSLGSICVSSSYKHLRRKYYIRLLLKSFLFFAAKRLIKGSQKTLNTRWKCTFWVCLGIHEIAILLIGFFGQKIQKMSLIHL